MGTAAATTRRTKPIVNGLRAGASTEPKEVADVIVPPLDERGIDGIGNYGGTLNYENNPALFHIEAFGRAGSREWGEWDLRRRTDEAMAKAIDFVLAPMRDAVVSVTPAGDSPLQQQQADFIKWNLTEALEPGWAEFLNQTAGGAIACGFALHEKIFAVCEHEMLPNGRGYRIARLAERLPASLPANAWVETPSPDGGVELKSIRQQGPIGGKWAQLELPASKVLLHTWQRNGNNYAGNSAFRAVWYATKIRESLLKLVAVSLVREGAGIPIAFTTDPKAELSKEQRNAFVKLLQNLVYHENAGVVMPEGWQMEWVYSPGANKGHVVDTFNHLGLLILEQVGAQQLYLGTSGTGSRSVGEVHQAQSAMFVRSLIRSTVDVINGVGARPYEGLICNLVDVNWGPPKDGRYPKLGLEPQNPELKPDVLADALTKGKASGVFTPTLADENAFRKKVGLSPISEEDRKAAKEEASKLAPPNPFHPSPFPPKAEAALRASNEPFVPRRPLRASEKVLDLQAIAKLFDASRADFERRMRPLVAELLMRALPDVKAAMADGDASDVGDVMLDMSRVDAEVKSYLEKLRAEGYRHVKAEKVRGRPAHASAEEDDQYTDSPAAADAQSQLDSQRKHLVKKMRNRLSSDLEKEAIDVERTDGNPEEAVSLTLQRQVDTGAYRQDAGLVTTKAFNVGRDEFTQEFGDQVASVELSAILDNATCGPCEQLDGEEFDFNSPEHLDNIPPLSSKCDGGDNCRCLLLVNWKADE